MNIRVLDGKDIVVWTRGGAGGFKYVEKEESLCLAMAGESCLA
jgi:hypothetical protein